MKLTRANRTMSARFFFVGTARQPHSNYWTLIGLRKCDGRRGKPFIFFKPTVPYENNPPKSVFFHLHFGFTDAESKDNVIRI